MVVLSAFRLFWQLFVLFACCSGLGLTFRSLVPRECSLLNKVLFSAMGGLFLVVLVPQNLVYLGVPVRISAWVLLAAALVQVCLCRHKLIAWIERFYANAEMRTLAVIILLTVTFHGIVPIRQGLEWYYGKGHFDQINYVLIAEFLKEEPYGTSEKEIGLRPWLVAPVGVQEFPGELGKSSGSRPETIGLKDERIGQSVITAEISAWSGTDGKGGYAATVIFFLTVLAICLYGLLRLIGVDRFIAASGALLAACLPVVTRLSLEGFLSQVGIFFVFPFFACLLQEQSLSARSFTVFFSLTLAYLIAVYSEIVPIGLCTLFLGVLFVRQDNPRAKRLTLMSAILLITLVNPYYLRNLVEFLGYQYNLVANAASLWDNAAPDVLTLRGWSDLIFGDITSPSLVLVFEGCALLLGLLLLAGVILLSRRQRLILGAILLPAILVIIYLTTRTPPSYYPMAKITLTMLPLVTALFFVPLSRVATKRKDRPLAILIKLLCAAIVVAAASGSVRSYSKVLKNEGLLSVFRKPRFLKVCRDLEATKSKRVLVFETHPLLAAWLCYHARHNDVYFDGQLISNSAIPPGLPFSKVPDLETVDFVVTRNQLVNLRTAGSVCLTSIDDTPGENWREGHVRYALGPPARLRFLALHPLSANLKLRFTPGPAATAAADFILTDAQGNVCQSEIQGGNSDVWRTNIPRGLSFLELSIKVRSEGGQAPGTSIPILAELDGIELSEIDAKPGG
jgi:hypothetical protein